MYGNNNAGKVFSIPVEWVVTENIEIKADSLEEAVKFIVDNTELIPCGSDATYVDGTYKISADTLNESNVEKIAENLKYDWGCEGRDATELDVVTSKIGGAA